MISAKASYLDAFWRVFHVKNVVDVSRSQLCVLFFTWLVTSQENTKDPHCVLFHAPYVLYILYKSS